MIHDLGRVRSGGLPGFALLPLAVVLLSAAGVDPGSFALAQEVTATDDLALRQSELADRYSRMEKLILRMAEFDASDNPRRAELLKKAFALSKDRRVQLQLEELVGLLREDKLSRAVSDQGVVAQDLKALLELLLTENRSDRLKDEQRRIKDYIREIERIERMQRSVQGRTEGGVEMEKLAREQQRIAGRTGELAEEIERNEAAATGDQDESAENSENSESPSSESGTESQDGKSGSSSDSPSPAGKSAESSKSAESEQSGDSPQEPGEPSENESGDGETKNPGENRDQGTDEDSVKEPQQEPSDESKAGETQEPSESSQGENGKSSDAQPPDGGGQPSQGQPSGEGQEGGASGDSQPSSQQPPEQFPGQERIRQAERKMQQAQQKLAEAKRQAAIQDEEAAARKLAEAKAELEELLRQKREEEIGRTLAMLESRFRKMLEMELQVYESTMRLYKIPPARRNRFVDIEAGKLSFQQRRIVVESDKCLALLQEEGSSVAFPESVQQLREDMEHVEQRLGRSQIGRLTQGIEEDVIEALDEMIEALQKAQKDQEERQQQQSQQTPMQMSEDQSLVDKIAELKMLKAMQKRINKRTTTYARLLDDDADIVGQATDAELIDALQELSDREQRLQSITHDIVVGKNQ